MIRPAFRPAASPSNTSTTLAKVLTLPFSLVRPQTSLADGFLPGL